MPAAPPTSSSPAPAAPPAGIPAPAAAQASLNSAAGNAIQWNLATPISVTLKDAAGQPVATPVCSSADTAKVVVSADCSRVTVKRLGAQSVTVSGGASIATLTLQGVPQRHWSGLHGVDGAFSSGDTSFVPQQDGTLLAWGSNPRDILGQNFNETQLPFLSAPKTVLDATGKQALHAIYQASGGAATALALTEDGKVWGWGSNDYSQLPQPSPLAGWALLPVQLRNAANNGELDHVVQVEIGDINTLALLDDGTVMTWGHYHGQDDQPLKLFPGLVKTPDGSDILRNIVAVSAGSNFSLALTDDGRVYSWGFDLEAGSLGAGKTFLQPTPLPFAVIKQDGSPLSNIVSISAGYLHTLALAADGTVWAWGNNTKGTIGQGSALSNSIPYAVQVKSSTGDGVLSDIVMVAAGGNHSVALDKNGRVWTWGFNLDSQLGDGPSNPAGDTSRLPRLVVNETATGSLGGIVSISAGSRTTFAVKVDGTVLGWGNGFSASLGRGIDEATWHDANVPAPVRNVGNTGPLVLPNLAAYPNIVRRAR